MGQYKRMNNKMKQAQIKMLHEAGAVSNPTITRTILGKKWQLMFDIKAATGKTTVVLYTKRGKPREFSSLNAVIKTLDEAYE